MGELINVDGFMISKNNLGGEMCELCGARRNTEYGVDGLAKGMEREGETGIEKGN
jgi:hypothetical protein